MNRALIVVDVQESFRARPEWSRMADPDIARSVDRLVALARDRGDLVVRVLHTEPGTGNVFDPGRGTSARSPSWPRRCPANPS